MNIILYTRPSEQPFSSLFSGSPPTPSFLKPPHTQLLIVKASLFNLLPKLYPDAKRRPLGRHLHPSLASLHIFSLRPAPCACVFFYSSASALPTLSPLAWTQAPVGLGGVGFARCGYLRVSVFLPRPPQVLPRILAPSSSWYCYRVDFCEKSRGQGVSIPWQSHALVLSPLATCPCRRCSGSPAPSPLYPYLFVVFTNW